MNSSANDYPVELTPSAERVATLQAESPAFDLPMPENKRYYPALDGLRAIAVLMVFYQHYLSASQTLALSWGWAGVNIFFVLSGFLITGILFDTRNTPHRFRNFYVRRTLRIFPLYYAMLLIALLANPIFHWISKDWYLWPYYLGNYARFIWLSDFIKGAGTADLIRWPLHASVAMNFGHFWSLCVEEQFYLVWPLFVFFIKDRKQLRNFCAIICLLSLAARIACVCFVPQSYLAAGLAGRLTPLCADSLLLGGLFSLMLRGPEAQWLKKALRPSLYIFVGCFIAFEVISRLQVQHFYYPDITSPMLSTVGFTLIDLFAAILVLLLLEPAGLIYRLTTLRPLRFLGQISYGFYVFHDIPHAGYTSLVAHNLSPEVRTYATAALAFMGTLILSYLSFRFFESPFLRVKERFTI
jgi:peptidoglycan/LPS O-acetylase OafA/YrhL